MKKSLKKVLAGVSAAALILAMQVQTFAATESDILNALKSGVTVEGTHKNIPDKFIKLTGDFLNSNNLTEAELSEAMSEFQSAKSAWIATGKVNFSEMTPAQQQNLQAKAAAAANKVGATLMFDGNSIQVIDKDGKVYSSIITPQVKITGGNTIATSYGLDNPIKRTGANMDFSMLYTASVLIAIGMGSTVLFARKYNLNEGC